MNDGVRPYRHTRHRDQIGALLRGTTEFLSAQRIHALLQQQSITIGLTTVYRVLQSFAELGTVDTVRTANGEQLYRHCSSSHHHHLMCRTCAHAIEVEGPAIEQWATAVAAQHGFRDINHSVEIFGVCRSCTSGEQARP